MSLDSEDPQRLLNKIKELERKLGNARRQADESAAKVTELEAKLSDAPDPKKWEKRLDRFERERDEARKELAALRSETETKEVLYASGITDPQDQDLIRYKLSRIPDTERPSLEEYIGEKGAARQDKHLAGLWAKESKSPNTEPPDSPHNPAPSHQVRTTAPPPSTLTGTQPSDGAESPKDWRWLQDRLLQPDGTKWLMSDEGRTESALINGLTDGYPPSNR